MSNDLENALTSDLTWRETELAILKIEIVKAQKGSAKQIALLRASWAMLYAHYEGFSVFAWASYLNELKRVGIPRGDLSRELIALSMETQFKAIKNSYSMENMLNFYSDEFDKILREPVTFPNGLKARSNLSPELYRTNCRRASLSHLMVDQNEARLLLLVKRRNSIAHGEAILIKDITEYQSYETAVMLVMHELALGVIENVGRFPIQYTLAV